jgi:hypothetical protein
MRTVHQAGPVSLQSPVMRVTKSHLAVGHPGSSTSSSTLTFPIDSLSLGISAPLIRPTPIYEVFKIRFYC